MNLETFNKKSASDYAMHKKVNDKLRNLKPKVLDEKFQQAHEDKFQKMDCLNCANCCKTTSPIFLQTDIERLSRLLKMKSSKFIDTYLNRDDEGDYVLKNSPCPFLGDDNKCFVYEDRPKACREYPHTNRKKMHGILGLTLRNTLVCPVVYEIFQDFSKDFRR